MDEVDERADDGVMYEVDSVPVVEEVEELVVAGVSNDLGVKLSAVVACECFRLEFIVG